MARFSEEELSRLKSEVSLVRLVEASGVQLTKHGSDLLGLCPFHDDKEPSLVISPEKNLWHCLGACQQGGSVIDWVMKREGLTFRHAVVLLKSGHLPATTARPVKQSTVRKLPPPVSFDAEDAELLSQVVAHYHDNLLSTPAALAYLGKRGVRDEAAIERFRLGFADRTLGLRLPAKGWKAGAAIRSRLTKLGILRESGHEHLAGCLVVPILSGEGEVLNLYGRKITAALRAGTALHLYLPGPRRGVFNLAALRESKELILCESLFDALTFWCHGFRHVTTSYGVNGFTEELHQVLRAYAVERLLIAYDRDDAGDKAAEELAGKLGGEGIGCFRVLFPKGMDANEYAVKVQPAEASLALALKSAEWMAGPTRRVPAAAASSPAAGPTAPASPAEPASPLAASPEPAEEAAAKEESPRVEEPAVQLPAAGEAIELVFGDRTYRVRGLERNLSYEQLKVILRVSRGESFFLDSVDLVSARQRAQFVRQAAVDLGVKEDVVKKDLGRVHFHLEELQEALIKNTLEPKGPRAVVLTPEEAQEAMDLLKDPLLTERILEDFGLCGVVGEETNKLLGYLAAVSRKLDDPLAVILQSSSAAGKSALMEAILALVPEEERVSYSAMTGQSLFYMGEANLKHKLLAVAEEEGAERASYALKLLQSEGELTIASTGKDPHTGRLVTHEYRVEGPVAIFLTTTAIEIDEELLNRCIVLTVDEDREQTRAIHRLQRERRTLEGFLSRQERSAILRRHRNAQRLLKPLPVVNPFAPQLTFLDSQTRTRRDHEKYLTLIDAVALLHQHQRPRKTVEHQGQSLEVLEVTAEDVALANRLAGEALGRSLDELPPQTRRLLEVLDRMVTAECERLKIDRPDYRFHRRQLVEATRWSLTQVRLHLERLVAMEYVLVHRGSRGQSFVYELLYDGQGEEGKRFLVGLIDAEGLHLAGEKAEVAGSEGDLAGSKRGQNAPLAGGWRGGKAARKSLKNSGLSDSPSKSLETAPEGSPDLSPSYRKIAAAPRSSF